MEMEMGMCRRNFLGLTFSAVSLAALVGNGALASDEAPAGRISRVSGNVTLLRGGQVQAGAPGDAIYVSDSIRTAADSRAEVTFDDGSVLTVGPDSEVAIETFAPVAEESTAVLDLLAGIVRVTVNKATDWGRFDVRTTTAVASVRGTDYLVESNEAGSAVFVAEGRVAVSSRAGAGTAVLRAGQGVDVTAAFEPPVVKIWGAKRRDAALARVTF
jgi:hypothetical protein